MERKNTLYHITLSFILLVVFIFSSCEKDPRIGEVFELAEVMPQFPGGEQALISYLTKNIEYPERAKANNTQGLVVISFIVEIDGKISTVEILQDIGDGCGEEAKRVVESMPNWTPGLQRGEPVRVAFKLPVRFKLE